MLNLTACLGPAGSARLPAGPGDPARLPAGPGDPVRLPQLDSLRLVRPGLVVMSPPACEATSVTVYYLPHLFVSSREGTSNADPADMSVAELPPPLRICHNLGFLCFDKLGYVSVDSFKHCLVIHIVIW